MQQLTLESVNVNVNGSVLDIGNSYPVQITQQNHHQVAGVERLKSEFRV